MGDIVLIAAVLVVFAAIGGVGVVKLAPHKEVREEARGTWYRAQETVAARNSSFVRVILVREHEGKENARLVVAEIDSRDTSFSTQLQDAIAEADNRLATLESGERR